MSVMNITAKLDSDRQACRKNQPHCNCSRLYKSMFTPITPSATTLSELAAQVWNSGKISSQDRQFLRSLFTEHLPSEEEIAAVDRLLHAIRRGWIEMLE